MQGIGDRFQQGTKYSLEGLGDEKGWQFDAEAFKDYPDAPRVKLAAPEAIAMPVGEAMRLRRSLRDYTGRPIRLGCLIQILWAASGVTERRGGCVLRTAPSAGALYPIETYLLANRVDDLAAGLYHLNVRLWELELLKQGDLGPRLARACLGQGMMAAASVDLIWTAVVGRSKRKYGERAYRYVYLDAGHICENVYLAATALGLGCCGVGAFYDDEVNAIIGVNGKAETTVYLASIGTLG